MATSVPLTSVPQKVRNVCFTINNWTHEQWQHLDANSGTTTYLVVGKEVGESGTPHLQCYAEFENPRSTGKGWSNFRKLFGNGHFEVRRGTAKQAADYCKKDGDFTEWGEITRQGERTDWAAATAAVLSGGSIVEVVQEQPQLLPAIRALERLQNLSIAPLEREVHTTWLFGPPGSGKTRYVWDNFPNVYSKPSGPWWDGYSGEEVLLLDDFDGDILYTEFLKVLDRYKYRVPVKGGYVGARWNKIFITTNKPPHEFYRKGNRDALKRRIHEVRILNSPDRVYNGTQTYVWPGQCEGEGRVEEGHKETEGSQ